MNVELLEISHIKMYDKTPDMLFSTSKFTAELLHVNTLPSITNQNTHTHTHEKTCSRSIKEKPQTTSR